MDAPSRVPPGIEMAEAVRARIQDARETWREHADRTERRTFKR